MNMKKNNKGFFLAETIVILALITTIIAFVYPNVAKLYENYDNKTNYYDQPEDIYRLRWAYDYLKNTESNEENKTWLVSLTESGCKKYDNMQKISVLDDVSGFVSQNVNSVEIYIAGYMDTPTDSDYQFNKYLHRMKKSKYDSSSYRLIGKFLLDNGKTRYASIKIKNPSGNVVCSSDLKIDIEGTYNSDTEWYYNVKPSAKLTINSTQQIKKVQECLGDVCSDITSQIQDKTYTHSNLDDTNLTIVKYQVTFENGVTSSVSKEYRSDTVAPSFAFKGFCAGSFIDGADQANYKFNYNHVNASGTKTQLSSTYVNNDCQPKDNYSQVVYSNQVDCKFPVSFTDGVNSLEANFTTSLSRSRQQELLYGAPNTWQMYILGYNHIMATIMYDFTSGIESTSFIYAKKTDLQANAGFSQPEPVITNGGKIRYYLFPVTTNSLNEDIGFKLTKLCDNAGNCNTQGVNNIYTQSISCSKDYANQASENFYNCITNNNSISISNISVETHKSCSAMFTHCTSSLGDSECEKSYNAKYAACMKKCMKDSNNSYEYCSKDYGCAQNYNGNNYTNVCNNEINKTKQSDGTCR